MTVPRDKQTQSELEVRREETMKAEYLLITNNPKAAEVYKDNVLIGVEFLESGSYLDVLLCTRDRIHRGWHLLTHPQASNLKPNQCPYKTVLITNGRAAQEFARDIELIENAVEAHSKFTRGMKLPRWTDRVLRDFMTVDLSVVQSALESSLLKQIMSSHI